MSEKLDESRTDLLAATVALPLTYRADSMRPLRVPIRLLGIALIGLGVVGAAAALIELRMLHFYVAPLQPRGASPVLFKGPLVLFNILILLVKILELTSGVAALRLSWIAWRLLRFWAFSSMGLGLFTFCFSAWTEEQWLRNQPLDEVIYNWSSLVGLSVAHLSAPLLALFITSLPQFRQSPSYEAASID